ncbi:TetR/AcrR family transcriptional regulator [Maricaulis parjimensis]|uniref:TetR/AcrR family transcriptional regulator n=1 Tax=Maricaulis parjimensis TaxID=144023 RepID=UPI0019399E54|nr:TetR/AcrR family transcriptional regulator [Maricaulis parjimensis]
MPRSQNDSTRTTILKACRQLLEAGSGQPVRMSDVAKAAGVSRQAVYLHFPKRADLLIETARHIDDASDVDTRLAPSRNASSGVERLDRYIEAWGNYIPVVIPTARALIAMSETDEDARTTWANRMAAMREGCAAAVKALEADGNLSPALSAERATDLLWTLLSVGHWEDLVERCGWSQSDYVDSLKQLARAALLAPAAQARQPRITAL